MGSAIESAYDPVQRYKTEFGNKLSQLAAEKFEELLATSGVNESENAALNKRRRAKAEEKANVSKRLSRFRSLRGLLIFVLICAVVGFILLFTDAFDSDLRMQVSVWSLVIGSISIFGIVKLSDQVSSVSEILKKVGAELAAIEAEARAQMAPLLALFDWDTAHELFEQTMPNLVFDPFMSSDRLDDLATNFDLDTSPRSDSSVVFSHSGTLFGYPFVFGQTINQFWTQKAYSASIVVSVRKTVRDANGKTQTVVSSERLTATIYKPFPDYGTSKFLYYGNDLARALTFSREPSRFSGKKEHMFDGRARELKRLRKFEQNLTDANPYTMLSNEKFELLFHSTNRNDEQGFRRLFTPQSQMQMVNLLNDTEVGYGDDFTYRKNRGTTKICPKHLSNCSLNFNPSQFSSFEVAQTRKLFRSFCENTFKHIYFSLAPILTIVEYHNRRPQPPPGPYGPKNVPNVSSWTCEELANAHGYSHFAHPSSATKSILSVVDVTHYSDGSAESQIVAYSFRGVQRTETVRKVASDGRSHLITVPWTEYLPVSNISTMSIAKAPDIKQSQINDPYKREELNKVSASSGFSKAAMFRNYLLSEVE